MIKHALMNPTTVGAVTSSSPALVKNMVAPINDGHRLIVELGGGKGTITAEIAEKLNSNQSLVSIEIDPALAKIAGKRVTGSVDIVVDSALNLQAHTANRPVDCIICSLPLTLFSGQDLHQLFANIKACLDPQGIFVFYLYKTGQWLPQYRKVISAAQTHFSEVTRTKITWLSIPPANVYQCG